MDSTEDFFKDYPNPAAQGANPAAAGGGGGDFFSSEWNGGGATENGTNAAAAGGDAGTGFVMGSSAPPEEVKVEDADLDDDDDEDQPSTPPAIKQWRVDFATRLEKKQAHERRVKEETQTEAQATIQKMHGRWQERVANNKKVNQDYEAKFVAERDNVLKQFSKPGDKPNWNVVPQLANLTGNYTEGQRDTSRMRSVILKLKTG